MTGVGENGGRTGEERGEGGDSIAGSNNVVEVQSGKNTLTDAPDLQTELTGEARLFLGLDHFHIVEVHLDQ